MRLIDADALMRSIGCEDATKYGNKTTEQRNNSYSTMMMYEIANAIDDAPTIEAEPVRHGRWVDRYGNKYDNHLYECSECKGKARYRFKRDELGKEIAEQALDDYCPHCGVKMDGGVSNEG